MGERWIYGIGVFIFRLIHLSGGVGVEGHHKILEYQHAEFFLLLMPIS